MMLIMMIKIRRLFSVVLVNSLCFAGITNNLENRPAARQLRYSLLQYMTGPIFEPTAHIDENQLLNLFK